MVTMLLGGLWHGAGWTFVLWGALHGIYLILNHAWGPLHGRASPAAAQPVGWALTMLGVVVAWVFFRATSFGAALDILGAMVPLDGAAGGAAAAPAGLPDPLLGWLLIGFGGLVAVSQPNVLEVARYPQGLEEMGETGGAAPRAGFDLRRLAASPAFASVCLGLLAAACIARLPKPGVFLYFTF